MFSHGDADAHDNLPWCRNDRPEIAFKKLVKAVWQHVDQGTPNPQLERIFDYYLRMVWQLSLAIPVPYVRATHSNFSLKTRSISSKCRSAAELRQPSSNSATTRLFEKKGDRLCSRCWVRLHRVCRRSADRSSTSVFRPPPDEPRS